jgi:hypothetical protein
MAIRFDLKAALLAALLVGACGEEDPQAPDEQSDDGPSTAKDGGRNNGKADAGRGSKPADDEDDEDPDEPVDDDEPTDNEDDEDPDVGGETGSKLDGGKAADAGASSGSVDAGKASADAGTPRDAGGGGGGGALTCEALTYESFGKAFFMTNCAGCHTGAAAQAKVKLDSLPEVMKNKAAVLQEAVTEKKMPPPPAKLSADDLQKLQKFLECGPK